MLNVPLSPLICQRSHTKLETTSNATNAVAKARPTQSRLRRMRRNSRIAVEYACRGMTAGRSLMKLVPVALLTVALAVAAAGCGNSESAQEKWANDVCTPIGNWQDQMKQLVNDAKSAVQSPSASTVSSLQSDAKQAESATKDLRPTSERRSRAGGQRPDGGADAQLVRLHNEQDLSALKSAVDGLSTSTSVSQAATALSSSASQLSGLASQTQTALNSVQQTSSELKSGFQDASACKDLKKSS